MSRRNGDRSRFHRIRKKKMARRVRYRELLVQEAASKSTDKA